MNEQLENDPWLSAIVTFQFFACIVAWIFLIARWRRNGELLPYEPRRPVPWGIAGALLAVAFTALTIVTAFASDGAPIQPEEQTPQEQMLGLAAAMVMQALGPMLLIFIAAMSKATWSDVGLPSRSAATWARDIAIGAVACLAAILPVGIVNYAARAAMNSPDELTKHPLVEMLLKSEPNLMVLALSTVMAAIVAPIAEEITFRLLLQGWLEKWEDQQLGWRNVPQSDSPTSEVSQNAETPDMPPEFAEEVPLESIAVATEPPKHGVAGLPYGWTPIIVSSLIFAAAHYGYGPEPVPLFVLALILGYCYQRTHRIVPSIVAHGLFNLISMIALWRVVFLGGTP